MDPTLLAYAHSREWEKLSALASKKRLDPAEAREFLTLYRHASKDLSRIQTVAPDSEIAARVTNIIHRCRQQLTGVPVGFKATLMRFFGVSLPAALWDIRWYFLGVFVFSVGIAAATTVWLLNAPEDLFQIVSYDSAYMLAHRDFVEYYKENPNSIFAVGVWANNAWLAVQWVALGITGVYVIYGLLINAFNVGVSGAVMMHFDRGQDFFLYILPHGVPELTCIFIAGAAGLKIFTSWIIPRNMTRSQSLAQGARSLFSVALGLVLFLFLSGLIEGFVTPNDIPFAVKMAVGSLLTVGIVAYAIALGRPAAQAGIVGDLHDDKVGYRAVTAA